MSALAHTLALLRDELTHSIALLELLVKEQQALSGADLLALSSLRDKKNTIVVALAGCASARHAAIVAAGCALTLHGVQQWLADMRAAPGMEAAQQRQLHGEVGSSWLQLLQTMLQAKEQNRINGLLIARQAHSTDLLLHSLQASRVTSAEYGADGYNRFRVSSRPLAVG
jgi:flagella synthesis protein FlgN